MKAITRFTLVYFLLVMQEADAQHQGGTPDEDLVMSWIDITAVSPSGRVVLQGRRPDGSYWELVISCDNHLKSEYASFPGTCPATAGCQSVVSPNMLRLVKPALPSSPYFICVRIRAPAVS